MKTTRRLSLLMLVAATLLSCIRAGDFETYTARPQKGQFVSGSYLEFRIPVEDTLTPVNIEIFARIHSESGLVELPLRFRIGSPSGKWYADSLSLQLTGEGKEMFSRSGMWRDFRWVYRKGVIFPESGTWYIQAYHTSDVRVLEGVGELGIIVKKSREL